MSKPLTFKQMDHVGAFQPSKYGKIDFSEWAKGNNNTNRQKSVLKRKRK